MTRAAAPRISVVIPTIKGREHWLYSCFRAYERRTPGAELIVIHDAPNCGTAWAEGASRATCDYLHFTADDLIPFKHWWEDAVATADRGAIPVAQVQDARGLPAGCACPLGELGRVPNVLVPFFSRALFDRGGWVLPIHYGTDDWVTYMAARRGIEMASAPGYRFVHHVAQEGREVASRRPEDVRRLCGYMGTEGYVPPVYAGLARDLAAQVANLPVVRVER